ncbi:hypothetical protein N7519_000490 [Penicillium mononematosum]|uniref:uncharacterized protein n=1 Tax=Penicillium mononematosum TaxID=268346 RepID=UPI00254667A9|nr:uncharacterized protein N7519_000490 [Penicillium mononematosum]KAJ6190469.1 hypothetical protein N7519_000490 [Penicillium mononematosum]
MTSDPTSSTVVPPSDSVHHNAALEPWQPVKGRGRTHLLKRHARNARYHPYRGSRVRRVCQKVTGMVESCGNEADRKKRLTEEMVEGNGSLLLSISDKYAMDTAGQVSEVIVPAVSQSAQTDLEYTERVSTEQLPAEAVLVSST